MSFIDLKNGISVRKSDIEAIIRVDDKTCKVCTATNKYEAKFTYEAMRTLLSMGGENLLYEKLNRIINQQQIFSG